MGKNPLRTLQDFGQSIWLDFIRRKMVLSGELRRLIEQDGIRGVTSNPAIFEKAIDGSQDYDDDISNLALEGLSTQNIYEALTVRDVQMAADLLFPLFDGSGGRHGFVSLEVNPHLARDEQGTIAEARHLWKVLDRPNAMIKIPATRQGLTCIRRLIGEGINVNVTLLFGLPRYQEVSEAYIGGLEDRVTAGESLTGIASVASFFLSRIDVMVDPKLKEIMASQPVQREKAEGIYGQVAIASARCAYQIYREMVDGVRFQRLAERGARPQRLLWASTSTKEPAFNDIKYVEALIGTDTVNTLPRKTLDAYRDHGHPEQRLDEAPQASRQVLDHLAELEIGIDQVTRKLVDQGIEKFNKPYDRSMDSLEKSRQAALKGAVDRQTVLVEEAAHAHIDERLAQMQREDVNRRLWDKDAGIWLPDGADQQAATRGLGWLTVPAAMREPLEALNAFREELLDEGFTHVLHMGMGGSSLAPLVFQRSFPASRQGLALTVLDTTDPRSIDDVRRRLPLQRTLFIVASKSGTTAEPLAFGDYFFDVMKGLKRDAAGDHFAVITDPDSPLADLAETRAYRRTFLNFEDIGGRYSALSFFGLVPAALMGLDTTEMLVRAQRMAYACGPQRLAGESPGAVLGVALAELARMGRDKVTFVVPHSLETLGMWLEQLLAESTGKDAKGLLPVAGEPVAPPDFYGEDRVFVHIRLDSEADDRQTRSVAALGNAGQPVIAIRLKDRLDLAQEFFRWEVATALAGAVLGINPFDQPNVQESKRNTNRMLKQVGEKSGLPEASPQLTDGSLALYLPSGAAGDTLSGTLAQFFDQVRPGDYIALLAYLTEDAAVESLLDAIRLRLQQQFKTAVTMGYGPRYLHSTGQYHKGGPDNGVYVQLTSDDAGDMEIPGKPYSFGKLRKAQAQGDLEALDGRGRRVLRLHLGADAASALVHFKQLLEVILPGSG